MSLEKRVRLLEKRLGLTNYKYSLAIAEQWYDKDTCVYHAFVSKDVDICMYETLGTIDNVIFRKPCDKNFWNDFCAEYGHLMVHVYDAFMLVEGYEIEELIKLM